VIKALRAAATTNLHLTITKDTYVLTLKKFRDKPGTKTSQAHNKPKLSLQITYKFKTSK